MWRGKRSGRRKTRPQKINTAQEGVLTCVKKGEGKGFMKESKTKRGWGL